MTKNNVIKLIVLLSSLTFLTAIFGILKLITDNIVCYVLFICCFTILFHFIIRLIVGETVTLVCKNKEFNNDSFWFTEHKFEKNLYKVLKVKIWKSKLITAKPEQFDLESVDLHTILHNINQAEIVHEISMVIAFIPLLFSIWWGAFYIFFITSFLSSLMDLSFVFIQRYNRPRIKKLIRKMEKKL